jgi:hypothetical protein
LGNISNSIETKLSLISIDSVPLAKNVNLDTLKDNDKNPLEIVVEIPASKSKRGWNYKPQAIKDIVNTVNESTLNGFLGHQKPENVDTEFPDIQTHWIGAKFDESNKTGYFRGLIDKDAVKLKRWIRGNRIKQVSIYGQPKIEKDSVGNINVVGYKAMSIDWTPLDRSGMPTKIVKASGEMFYDSLTGEQDNSNNDSLVLELSKQYNNFQILEKDDKNKLVTIAFKDNEGKFQTKSLKYDNINNNNADNNNNLNKGGNDKVEKSEILKELRSNYLEGKIVDSEIVEVLKLTQKTIIGNDVKDAVGEMTATEIKTAIEVYKNKEVDDAKNKKDEVIKELIKSKVTGEQQQKFVTETFLTNETDKEKIAGELETFLKKDVIKNTINGMANISNPNTGNSGNNPGNNGNSVGYLEDNKFLKPKVS